MLNTLSAKLTATPKASGWAMVYEFTPEDPEKRLARGRLLAVIATKRVEEGVEQVSLGRELLTRLHEEYFGSITSAPYNALKSAVEKVSLEFRENWGDVEIVAAAVVNDVVFSSVSGGGRVVIFRQGSLGTILDSGAGGDVISASGYPKEDDVMLLGTKSFFENISQGVIKAALGSATPEDAVETFAPTVHGDSGIGNMGAMVIKFDSEISPDAPSVEAIAPGLPKIDLSQKITSFINKISKNLPERGIYVRPEVSEEIPSQNKKLTFSVAIVLLLILVLSIGFGVRQKKINDLKNQYQGILVSAKSEVDEAISLASVSPDKSRELFNDAEQKLAQIDALKVKDPGIETLRSKINDSRASILGEYLVPPNLFLDLTLLSSGFKGDILSASGGQVYVLDKNGERVVSVAIDTKKSQVVAGPSLIANTSDIASYEDRPFILENDGVYEIDSGNKNKVVDKSWGGEAFVKAFAGNIYVMDKSGNQIYRYQGQGTAFSDKTNWLAAGTSVDFSNTREFQIDGSVYVLYPNAKILKFSLGSPQSFDLSGVVPDIGSIDAMYADGDNSDLYFLDKAGKRIVVTDKSGKYVAQYLDDQIGGATGLVVSEAQKKIILLTGDKLLSIDIKHLQ